MRTTRHVRPTLALAAALSLTLGLAACSGDPAESGESPATTGPTSESTTDAMPEAGEPMSEATASGTMLMPSGTGDPFADARTAAAHMPETGLELASGFVTALDIPGDAESDAANLRAGLTHLLQEHVYLAGMAVATAYTAGTDSPQLAAALAAVDANSVELGDAMTSIVGPEQGAVFLQTWRDHIGYFVDYAVAVKSGDQAAADAAVANLTAYTEAAGAFFDANTGGALPAAEVTTSLQHHVGTLKEAVDALAAGSPEAFTLLRHAGGHMEVDAEVLTNGIVTATGMSGDASDDASALRSRLTALLQEHVYLASVAVFVAYTSEGGTSSEAFAAAAAALDENSVALSEAIGSLAGTDKGEAFLALWREHIGYFVDYANAVATGDQAAAAAALTSLDGYRGSAGAFFEEISGGALPADTVAEGLRMHVETLAGAIDSLAGQLVQQ